MLYKFAKLSHNNPNIHLVKGQCIYKYCIQISLIHSPVIEWKRNFDNSKGHNSVVNLQKLTCNNPNVDLIKVNAYVKFDQISSIRSQDIEWKRNFDDNQGP